MRLDPTLVAARILGPLFVLAGILLITQPERAISLIGGYLADDSLLNLSAFISLIIGLTLVTFHQRWDTVTAAIISMIGWLLLARGGVMLLAPLDLVKQGLSFILDRRQIVPIGGCGAALLGVWLTYTGYIAGMLRFDHPTR